MIADPLCPFVQVFAGMKVKVEGSQKGPRPLVKDLVGVLVGDMVGA